MADFPPEESRAAGARVLLVDADAAVRAAVAFALEVEGFVVGAYETAEALLTLGAPQDSGCLVLDHRLPGTDGLALLGRLRASGVRSPAILLTSNPSRRLRRRIEDAGARLIEKPLLSQALAATIRSVAAPLPEPVQ